jgi:hypothetical protein
MLGCQKAGNPNYGAWISKAFMNILKSIGSNTVYEASNFYRSFFLIKILGIAGHQRASNQRNIITLIDSAALIAEGRHKIFGFFGNIAIAEHLIRHTITVSAGLIHGTRGTFLNYTTVHENRLGPGRLAVASATSRQTDK